jgi:hypothetical protein
MKATANDRHGPIDDLHRSSFTAVLTKQAIAELAQYLRSL